MPTATPTATPIATRVPVAERMYGVTMDRIERLPDIVEALHALRHRPTTRIVFDKDQDAAYYAVAVHQIHAVSSTLGQLLDSTDVKALSTEAVASRTRAFLATLGPDVDIWEIGNEINGWPWLGETPDVAAKMTTAFDIVDSNARPTALTLLYNRGCEEDADHEMFVWAAANIPERMRQRLTYVLVSFYEDDCPGANPDWPSVFDRLGRMFPHSKLGFGEVGTTDPGRKAEFIRRYYGMRLGNPAWIGGFFWWWGWEDIVPRSEPLWTVLDQSQSP
jgi:hypothetical protein